MDQQEKIVCVSGYFDPIHVGHIEYFKLSREIGTKLMVIVNNDHQATLKKGKSDDREFFINKLLNRNKNINFDIYGMNGMEPIWGDKFINILSRSSMGLNLSRGKSVKYYSSDRISQLMGNGLLTFVDKNTFFGDFFTNKEIITYNGIDDLSYKLNKYKKDNVQRKLIAKNGKNKYMKYFNSNVVCEFIINKTFELRNKKKFLWEK